MLERDDDARPALELLEPAAPAEEFERKLHPLLGIRWPMGDARRTMPGSVALFDVGDPGELQEW